MECSAYIKIKDQRTGEIQPVPCGQCYNCKTRRMASWAWRLQYEYKQSYFAKFITLTYSDEHIPKNGYLQKSDLQNFFKRYRKHLHRLPDPIPIKYFACGEYGGRTGRPHYHAILFNADVDIIEKAWNKGAVHYGDVNEATIMYTLKYMVKNKDKSTDRPPEFQVMSKGLGTGYLKSQPNIDWHNADYLNRYYLPLHEMKVPMPRLWKQIIFPDYKRKHVNKVFKRKKAEEPELDAHTQNVIAFESQRKLSTHSKNRNKV